MSISPEYYEAASIDGANFFQQLKSITIPLLKPVLVNATVLNVTYGLRVFDMVYSLTNGGPGNATGVINTAVYKEFSKGTTLSSVLFFVVLALLYFIIKSMEDKEV
jgi:raffinose/stachyose/melibiose transport system permease protein